MSEQEFIDHIQRHAGIINKIIYLYVDDPEDKRDLRQEIQLQAWKSIDRFKGSSQFSTWLYRVALNTVLTFQRKKRIKTGRLGTLDIPQETDERTEQSDLLLRAIKRLNDVDKTIITLHLEDYDNTEISDIIGLQKNHVAVKIHRIKEGLKNTLTPLAHV